MEERTMGRPERERSHDLLQSIFHCQEEDSFARDLKAHRINEKYRMLEQRLHSTSKCGQFRQLSGLNRPQLGETHLLVKHQNKVEANIELHQPKLTNHFTPLAINNRSTLGGHTHSFFTPKTRSQILAKHCRPPSQTQHRVQYKKNKN
jgi:hypothetical protein